MNMLYNKIENNMGVGVSAAILTGEVREAKQSTFNPLEKVPVSVYKWRHTVITVQTFVTLWIWCILNRFLVKKTSVHTYFHLWTYFIQQHFR